MGTRRYVRPAINVFKSEDIENLVPLMMSGGGFDCTEIGIGGGGSSSGGETSDPVLNYLYFLNSPDNPDGLGHGALLFEFDTGHCELYSFHPANNETGLYEGSFAYIAEFKDAYSFDAFKRACFTKDPKDSSRIGIHVKNGHTEWYEPFRRAIKLRTSQSKMNTMYEAAKAKSRNPPPYFIGSYNCQTFVNEILIGGGVSLGSWSDVENSRVPLHNCHVPNLFYTSSSKKGSEGITDFEKIVF